MTMVRCLMIFRNWQDSPGYTERLQDSKEEVGVKPYTLFSLTVCGNDTAVEPTGLDFNPCFIIYKMYSDR